MKLSIALFALAAIASTPAAAQTDGGLAGVIPAAERSMISYTTIGRETAIAPFDVFEIEISSSGGLTDIFVRLAPTAGSELAQMTALASGEPMRISLCGMPVLTTQSAAHNTSNALYIPNLTFVQADALRSVWHGRETCTTLDPEVFPIGQ